MSDNSESPEVDETALDVPEDKLSAELALEEEDSSLLDAGLDETAEEAEGDTGGLLEESNDSVHSEDPEIEAIKARVKEMEEEAEKLKEMQGEVEKQMMSAKTGPQYPTPEEKAEMDMRSVYVGNVDYQSTAEELGQHFQACGAINRVTILCDKFTGQPKGFAYIEFAEKEMVEKAVELNESLFKGRQIKVTAKRTNRPGISTTNRGFRGRRGRGRGFSSPYMMGGYMMVPVPSYPRGGRGRIFRGRARSNWYSPY